MTAASMTLLKHFEELDMSRWPAGAVDVDFDVDMPLIMGVKLRPNVGHWAGKEFSFHVEFPTAYPSTPPHACVARTSRNLALRAVEGVQCARRDFSHYVGAFPPSVATCNFPPSCPLQMVPHNHLAPEH